MIIAIRKYVYHCSFYKLEYILIDWFSTSVSRRSITVRNPEGHLEGNVRPWGHQIFMTNTQLANKYIEYETVFNVCTSCSILEKIGGVIKIECPVAQGQQYISSSNEWGVILVANVLLLIPFVFWCRLHWWKDWSRTMFCLYLKIIRRTIFDGLPESHNFKAFCDVVQVQI